MNRRIRRPGGRSSMQQRISADCTIADRPEEELPKSPQRTKGRQNAGMTNALRRPSWWGGSAHIVYTIVVFITLASLDNTAITLIPGMFKPLERGLGTSEAALAVIVGTQILVAAVTAVSWGYAGDAGSRKPLLFWGTVIWASGALLSATATTYWQFFGWQMIVAIGLGAIASVGFSVVSDFVGPRRRPGHELLGLVPGDRRMGWVVVGQPAGCR